MRKLLVGMVLLAAAASPAGAAPPSQVVVGRVEASASRWTADGSRIITESRVRQDDGTLREVVQLGGRVGGLSMHVIPSEPLLSPGMEVRLRTHPARSLGGQEFSVVDEILVQPGGLAPFVRTGTTGAGNYLYWESGCVMVIPHAEGTAQVAGDGEFTAISQALASWNSGTASCSFMNLLEQDPADREVGTDYHNVIRFRDTRWCRPATGDAPEACYSSSAAGVTTVVFVDDASSDRDGAIVDADIELNGVNFAIAVGGQSLGAAGCQADIGNTLTHELGHLLGLEHTCRAPGDPPRVDGDGDAVPACTGNSDPQIVDATMYNYQDCGETKKATLSADDLTAVCAIYPQAEDPGTCGAPGGASSGCCDSGAAPGRSLGLAAMTGLLLLVRRRRRGVRR